MEPEYMALVWYAMPAKGGPRPVKTTCLFTDGTMYWTGWYSATDQCIYIPSADGPHTVLSPDRVEYWADLPNFYAATNYQKPTSER